MTPSEIDWPAPDTPGLRIGDAAALMRITPKAIRVYHEYGLLPEPDRDASGYRRYDSGALVVLGRITRLRAAGLSLRAIRPLLTANDSGAALRAALQELDESLGDEIEQLSVSPALESLSPHDLQRWAAGLEAAALALPPAVRRVWELVLTDMVTAVSENKAMGY